MVDWWTGGLVTETIPSRIQSTNPPIHQSTNSAERRHPVHHVERLRELHGERMSAGPHKRCVRRGDVPLVAPIARLDQGRRRDTEPEPRLPIVEVRPASDPYRG